MHGSNPTSPPPRSTPPHRSGIEDQLHKARDEVKTCFAAVRAAADEREKVMLQHLEDTSFQEKLDIEGAVERVVRAKAALRLAQQSLSSNLERSQATEMAIPLMNRLETLRDEIMAGPQEFVSFQSKAQAAGHEGAHGAKEGGADGIKGQVNVRFEAATKLKQVKQAVLQLGTVSSDVLPPGEPGTNTGYQSTTLTLIRLARATRPTRPIRPTPLTPPTHPPGSSLAKGGKPEDGDGKVVRGEPNFPVRVAEGVHFVVSTGLKYEPKRTLPDTTAKCERVLIELRSGPDLPTDTPPGQLLGCIEVVTRTDIAQRTNHTSWQTFEAFGTTQDDRWTTPVSGGDDHKMSTTF